MMGSEPAVPLVGEAICGVVFEAAMRACIIAQLRGGRTARLSGDEGFAGNCYSHVNTQSGKYECAAWATAQLKKTAGLENGRDGSAWLEIAE